MANDLAKVEKMWEKKGLSLFDFQKDGVRRMLEWKADGHGGINGDEMGLGKTCQAIAVMLALHSRGEGPFLVLAPLSVAPHWVKEIERFGCGKLVPVYYRGAPDVRSKLISDKPSRSTVLVVPHHMFRREAHIFARWLKKVKCSFSSIFVDEAQVVKNYKSMIATRLRMFSGGCTFFMLTGTPVQNDLEELYSLLCFANPDIFPDKDDDFELFQETHMGSASFDDLKNILHKYMIRRTKSVVYTDIPSLEEVVVYHGLSPLQKSVYMDFVTKSGKEMKRKYGVANSTNCRMAQLRKTVSHPYLLKGVEPKPFTEGEHLVESSGKFQMLDSILKFLKKNNHRVLIFCQWIFTQDVVADYLDLRGYKYVYLNGGTGSFDREDAVDSFQRNSKNTAPSHEDPFVFLITTRAGGLGLTLTAADTVIFTDPDWNPQADEQAMARSHRIGQTKPVRVIRLIGRYTVEQVMFARAQSKFKLSTDVMEDQDDRAVFDADLANRVYSAASKIESSSEELLLSEADLETIIGTTDASTGHWIERPANKKRKVVDAQDVAVDDYLVYQGKSYRNYEDGDDLTVGPRERKEVRYDIDILPDKYFY